MEKNGKNTNTVNEKKKKKIERKIEIYITRLKVSGKIQLSFRSFRVSNEVGLI